MTKRQFSHEFKIEAVHLVMVRGVSVAQAARDLDVHATRCFGAGSSNTGTILLACFPAWADDTRR